MNRYLIQGNKIVFSMRNGITEGDVAFVEETLNTNTSLKEVLLDVKNSEHINMFLFTLLIFLLSMNYKVCIIDATPKMIDLLDYYNLKDLITLL